MLLFSILGAGGCNSKKIDELAKQVEELKSKAETTKKKIENKIHSLENKTDELNVQCLLFNIVIIPLSSLGCFIKKIPVGSN